MMDLNPEDQALRENLQEIGFKVDVIAWDDPGLLENAPDVVVIRSTWDYHLRVFQFKKVIEELEQLGVVVCNSSALIHWNSDKIYLSELERKGVSIVPTEFFHWDIVDRLESSFELFSSETLVVKPRVSASAFSTFKVNKDQWDNSKELKNEVHAALVGRDVMVQPFLEEIRSEGEWSIVFLGGELSHSILKTPKGGDFRVQEEYGGTSLLSEPKAESLKLAEVTLKSLNEEPFYARVDIVQTANGPQLIELELIEPFLFLDYKPGSVEKLSGLLKDYVFHDRKKYSQKSDLNSRVRYVKSTHGKTAASLFYRSEFLRVYYYGLFYKHSNLARWITKKKYETIAVYFKIRSWYLLYIHWRMAKYFSGDMMYHWFKQHVVWRVAFVLSGAYFRRILKRGASKK